MTGMYEVKKISVDQRKRESLESKVLLWSNEKVAYLCTSPNEISVVKEFQPRGESPVVEGSFKPKPSVNSEA
jgi:hypothetical protein